MKTINTPKVFHIWNYERELSKVLVGQTTIGELVAEEMLRKYSFKELNAMYNGQITKFNAIVKKVSQVLGNAASCRHDLFNYYAQNGKRADGVTGVHVVDDSSLEDAKLWVECAVDAADPC